MQSSSSNTLSRGAKKRKLPATTLINTNEERQGKRRAVSWASNMNHSGPSASAPNTQSTSSNPASKTKTVNSEPNDPELSSYLEQLALRRRVQGSKEDAEIAFLERRIKRSEGRIKFCALKQWLIVAQLRSKFFSINPARRGITRFQSKPKPLRPICKFAGVSFMSQAASR